MEGAICSIFIFPDTGETSGGSERQTKPEETGEPLRFSGFEKTDPPSVNDRQSRIP
jgi:hypothetical protein